MQLPDDMQPPTGNPGETAKREIHTSQMEPADKKPGADWHAITIYVKTDDPGLFIWALEERLRLSEYKVNEEVYVFYDGDLWHVEEPDLSNWDEIVARQRAKMSHGQTASGAVKNEKSL